MVVAGTSFGMTKSRAKAVETSAARTAAKQAVRFMAGIIGGK
jgi:hypothetical protein